MRTLEEHRQQYESVAARQRLREEVVAERERAALRVAHHEPLMKPAHTHVYRQFTFTCSCGKHGKVRW